ncbi:hypothetical protein P154DRAFT_213812 [Amniculicola lignicola CBS 123094]|uniref:Uncharacterized protein n=1 Tax=Amniculicola lignicola CBS 123094 TaxID=1392246 RepID=A0A6A5WI33_9PLEO|nr:hypothetical protein P154DRAFT_213812 [Amniculicola lignicola CBS 123094]
MQFTRVVLASGHTARHTVANGFDIGQSRGYLLALPCACARCCSRCCSRCCYAVLLGEQDHFLGARLARNTPPISEHHGQGAGSLSTALQSCQLPPHACIHGARSRCRRGPLPGSPGSARPPPTLLFVSAAVSMCQAWLPYRRRYRDARLFASNQQLIAPPGRRRCAICPLMLRLPAPLLPLRASE